MLCAERADIGSHVRYKAADFGILAGDGCAADAGLGIDGDDGKRGRNVGLGGI
jgi:hypothetical protein